MEETKTRSLHRVYKKICEMNVPMSRTEASYLQALSTQFTMYELGNVLAEVVIAEVKLISEPPGNPNGWVRVRRLEFKKRTQKPSVCVL